MNEFTVLISVDKASFLWAISSLIDVAGDRIHKFAVMDHSLNRRTSKSLDALVKEHGFKKIQVIQAPKKLTTEQAHHSLLCMPVQTPYIILSPPDIQFTDSSLLDKTIAEFDKNSLTSVLENGNITIARTYVIKNMKDHILQGVFKESITKSGHRIIKI